MKIVSWDIETYRKFFCFCAICYDSETHKELWRKSCCSDEHGIVSGSQLGTIESSLDDCDYHITYNGSKFDIPVLAKIRSDIDKIGMTSSGYIYNDASLLIAGRQDGAPVFFQRCRCGDWTRNHFDVLNNCTLGKSLKQWEMYLGLRIRELPFDPGSELTQEQKDEILDYCFYDCYALSEVYWRFGSGEHKTKYHTLRARKAILEKEWPADLPFRFDRSPQAVAAGIIYGTNSAVPPKTSDPLQLFDLDEFDVPTEVKDIIRLLAKSHPATDKEKRALAEKCTYNGIQFGKGGCHFIREGYHAGLFCFDVQSEYPRAIDHWHLLKTPAAIENWKDKMKARFAEKAKKGTPEYKADLDNGYKILVLNALSGGFRIRSGSSVAFDPAAGEAMCYIGQLVVTEMALSCPDWESVVEINTDSVFVKGEANAEALRRKGVQMLEKYEMLFEEEFIEQAYFRDVNNYGIYDKEGKLLDGRGLDYSDAVNKGHEMAVVHELFGNLLKPKLELDWTKYDWTDFIYKYHRSAASKYATIGGEPMTHKNYYFLWTTPDCPDSAIIKFSNDLMDTRNGSIKPRYGVYAFDLETLSKYKDYIDHSQYHRDLDENLYLWGRPDLVTTFVGDMKTRRANKVRIKSLADVLEVLYPWSEPPRTVKEADIVSLEDEIRGLGIMLAGIDGVSNGALKEDTEERLSECTRRLEAMRRGLGDEY